jgi:hypothetical protein
VRSPPDAPLPGDDNHVYPAAQQGHHRHHDVSAGDDDTARGNPLEPIPCQCWLCRWYRACDHAVDLNGAVRLDGANSVMVVADTVVAEVAANGGKIPDTYRLERDDGRTVYVFMDEATG